MSDLFPCFASAAFGLEGLVARELRALSLPDVRAENGGVRFSASLSDLFLCNLTLHTCDRVWILAAEKPCHTFEDLFQLVLSVPWEDYLSGREALNVSAKCARSQLMSPRDCQSVSKKAMIERLKRKKGLTLFPEDGALFFVSVSVHSDLVRVLINLSGESLSRRGYRTWNGEAPLRETLASALVSLSPWGKDLPLWDPCCGTGTIPLEAAFLASGRAPGLRRSFAMERYSFCRDLPVEDLRRRAEAEESQAPLPLIGGSDLDPAALDLAFRHRKQAGFSSGVEFRTLPLQSLNLEPERGVFLCNPPYGERLSDRKSCQLLYRDLHALKDRHPGWSLCAISSDPAFERAFGRRADKKRRLYNGRLECTFYIYF